MGFDQTTDNAGDDGGGGGKHSLSSSSTVSCSICLEFVTDVGDRSWAILQCGHQFHLDCIGSAFNIKGAMQCPNCRQIEKGQWLYASSSRSFTDLIEDWPHGEDLYELSYSEMFGVQWCPLPPFSRLPSFEENEFPSAAYQDITGQHGVFTEHAAVSSPTHQCPYVAAYYGPLRSSSSNSLISGSDGPNFSNVWGNPPGPSEVQTSYGFPNMESQYHGWSTHSMPFGASEYPSAPSANQRSSRTNADLPRPGSFIPPFVMSHTSSSRVGSSVTSSMVPPYPGSAARARDRVQALQAYFQRPSTSTSLPMIYGTQRSNHRGVSQVGPQPSSSDQTGGFYVFPSSTSNRGFREADNPSRFHGREREHNSWWAQ